MYEEYESYTDTLKRENSVLSEELKSLQEQVSERGMDKFEMQRNNKRLELERGELLEHIEELETNLTSEQGKQLKLQLEVTQYRSRLKINSLMERLLLLVLLLLYDISEVREKWRGSCWRRRRILII